MLGYLCLLFYLLFTLFWKLLTVGFDWFVVFCVFCVRRFWLVLLDWLSGGLWLVIFCLCCSFWLLSKFAGLSLVLGM